MITIIQTDRVIVWASHFPRPRPGIFVFASNGTFFSFCSTLDVANGNLLIIISIRNKRCRSCMGWQVKRREGSAFALLFLF